jgi:hypothetical protein
MQARLAKKVVALLCAVNRLAVRRSGVVAHAPLPMSARRCPQSLRLTFRAPSATLIR